MFTEFIQKQSSSGNSGLVGEGKIWFTNTAPEKYLICDGSAISRTTYSALFNVIGTTWGAGDGSTTFNLPNPLGKTLVMRDSGDPDFGNLGNIGGAKNITLTAGQIPAHTHDITYDLALTKQGTGANIGSFVNLGTGFSSATTTQNTPAGSSHSNLQPFLTVNLIIRYAL